MAVRRDLGENSHDFSLMTADENLIDIWTKDYKRGRRCPQCLIEIWASGSLRTVMGWRRSKRRLACFFSPAAVLTLWHCYFRQHQLSHIGILKTYYCCCCRCLDHDEEQVEASDAKAPLENVYPSAWGCDKKLLISRINLWSFLISFSSVNCGNKCRWLCHKGKMKSAQHMYCLHRRLTGIANITPDPWINVLLSHLDQLLLRHVCGAALSGLL